MKGINGIKFGNLSVITKFLYSESLIDQNKKNKRSLNRRNLCLICVGGNKFTRKTTITINVRYIYIIHINNKVTLRNTM